MIEHLSKTEWLQDELDKKLTSHDIKVVCFDADDTLFNTNKLFEKGMREFVHTVVSKNPGLDWREVWKTFINFNDEAYRQYSVQKEKMTTVSERLDAYYKTGRLFTEHTDVVLNIWNRAPKLFDGAREVLQIFSAVRPLVLVTHAEKRWTDMKLDTANIREFFKHVHIVFPNKFKGPEDWKEGLSAAGFIPSKAIGFGDNLKGDALACKEIGMKYFFLLKSPWKIYQEGLMVDGIIPLTHISHAPQAVIENL